MSHRPAWVVLFVLSLACGPSTPPALSDASPPSDALPDAEVDSAADTPGVDAAPNEKIKRARGEFAAKLASLEVGMSETEARAIVGAPDDVRTDHDPGGITASRTRIVWRFGTRAHLAFPTLGQIHIGNDGRVQYVYGGKGTPPPKELISERKLRRLLRLLDRVPSYQSQEYDPLTTIAAVNALQPLGKETALAVIAEYLRVRSPFEAPAGEGAFFVMRALFDVPPSGHMPTMMVGASVPPPPTDPKVFPRFPMMIEDGIPFVITSGYVLAGQAEPPEHHLDFFRKNGVVRSSLLRPADAPLEVVDRLVGQPRLAAAHRAGLDSPTGRIHIMKQGLRMVDSVYRPASAASSGFFPKHVPDPEWKTHLRAVKALGVKFNAKHGLYTLADGSHLPAIEPPSYRRAIWPLQVPGSRSARVVFERVNERRVSVSVQVNMLAHQVVPAIRIRVMNDAAELRAFEPFANQAGTKTQSTTGTQHNAYIDLSEKSTVTIEAVVDGRTSTSRSLSP